MRESKIITNGQTFTGKTNYFGDGLVKETIGGNGNTTRFEYDGVGHKTKETFAYFATKTSLQVKGLPQCPNRPSRWQRPDFGV